MSSCTRLLVLLLFLLVQSQVTPAWAGGAAPWPPKFREAEIAFQKWKYDEAIRLYQEILTELGATPAAWQLSKLHHRLGVAHAALGRFVEAEAHIRRVLEVENALPERTWGGNSPSAWSILPDLLFAQGRYAEALDALQEAHDDRRCSGLCGTGMMMREQRYRRQSAVLHEYLGDYRRAIETYLKLAQSEVPEVHLRLLRLYEASGQLGDLMKMIESEDARYEEMMRPFRERRGEKGPSIPERSAISRTIRRVLDLRELERLRDWEGLLSVLETASDRIGGGRRSEYEWKEAARLAARHPGEIVPLILPRLNEAVYGRFQEPMLFALALAGTPDAIAELKRRASLETNYYSHGAILHFLSLAGAPGLQALRELHPGGDMPERFEDPWKPRTLVKLPYELSREGTVYYPFPSLPETLSLPVRCEYSGPPAHEYRCDGSPADEAAPGLRGIERPPASP